jgi:hypothetical protein
MANLRIITDNAADRGVVSVPTGGTSGGMVAAFLQTDKKSEWHRSTARTVVYRTIWANGETVQGAGLPAISITSEATMRWRLWSDVAQTNLIGDTGVLDACPGLDMSDWDWDGELNGNAFPFGLLAKTAMWFPNALFARASEIEVADVTNPVAYLDNARQVIGPVWTPSKGASFGAQRVLNDATVNSRNDAQDLLSDIAGKNEGVVLDLKLMPEGDRARLFGLFRSAGVSRNLFMSLMPDQGMNILEQDGLFYGKRKNAPVGFDMVAAYSNRFEGEGW